MAAKFLSCAARATGAAHAREMLRALRTLEGVSDVRTLPLA
jgi:hypothetical protein